MEYNYKVYDSVDRGKFSEGKIDAESPADAIWKAATRHPCEKGFARISASRDNELVGLCDEGGFWSR